MKEMKFKGTSGKWKLNYQDGSWLIQDEESYQEGLRTCLAEVYYFHDGEDTAEANALLISKAPEMLQELQETLKDLLCIQGSIYNSSRIDARWEGAYDVIQKQIDKKKELIKQATEL